MNKGIFRKMAAAGLALMMLIALAPGMGLAFQMNATITYYSNTSAGSQSKSESAIIGNAYTIRSNPFGNSGGTFSGWNTEPNGTGDHYTPGTTTTVNTSLTLYAQWGGGLTNDVIITYKANANDNQSDYRDAVTKGSSYTIKENLFFVRAGYVFTGWNTKADGSGTSYQPGRTLTANGNNTLYAKWQSYTPVTATITYMANGSGQFNVVDIVSRGSSCTIRTNPFTSAGYIFNGWNTQPNGSGTAMSPGQVIIADNDYTLYAQWVTYDTIVDIPTGVNGRILHPWQTGDTNSNWIEIARNGKYSLIVRAVSICNVRFSDTNGDYWTSYLRGLCNNYFNSVKDYIYAPRTISLLATLPQNCRLRAYTVETNALYKIGTSSNYASLSDGFSKPTRFYARAGSDICFALSYTEAANFMSRVRFINGAYPNSQPSPDFAVSNYLKIVPIPQLYTDIWLRSPGSVYGTAAAITYSLSLQHGTVYQKNQVYETANIHPALWVDSAIFN